jgi:hypothetical protein
MSSNQQIAQRMAAPSPAPIKARSDLVRNVMAPYTAPMKKLRKYRQFDEWLPVVDLRTEKPEESDRKVAAERWQFIPDFRELLDAADSFGMAFNETDEGNIRVFVGLMLDGLPSTKTLPSASYTDALVFLLSGIDDDDDDQPIFSALVIAAAVVEVWKSSTFAPSPAEFLSLAKTKRREFHRAYHVAHRLYDLRCQAEVVLLHFGDIEDEVPWGDGDGGDIPF